MMSYIGAELITSHLVYNDSEIGVSNYKKMVSVNNCL